MITVTGPVAVVLIILGILTYVFESAKKVRDGQRRKAERDRVSQDLPKPMPSTDLPYGFSSESDPGDPKK